ncbi:uncharacterized protein LOC114077993 [Solanum pennellii]|uniref:Uncharacterized protein LOC114077993 n=1 Tax=Solanum pennellii TaxID=28526 RepID=A0ABM1VEX1_SOLPN|nr:uncharacterized protein LOC114077993 [Solanum pennellii]
MEKIETEVQELKANSQQHGSKHAELGQQHDQKHAELQGDVGKLRKTHNNVCSNAATASTSTAGQSTKKEETKVKHTNVNMNKLFSKPYTPQNTQKDISVTPQTNTYKASLESQKQTYNYISRTYIENIYKVQTFLNQNPRAKNTKNPNEDYITQYLQGYNKLIAQPGTNPNLIATCYNYGLLSTVYTVTGDEISKIPELYKAFLQYKRITKGTLFYIKFYAATAEILYDEVKPTIQVIKIGLTREMIIPEKIDTQEEIQKVDIPEFYANKRTIGIATILNEITNNYLNENAIWTYYNRDQTIIYSNCRDIREADMEELRQWILSLLRPETTPTTRAIRKNFISSNLMTRYCKLIGQKYPDHLCSKCEGEENYIPYVQLE